MTPRVHFAAQLAVPPADRPRTGKRYPAVAQNKDAPDRSKYKYLSWKTYAAVEEEDEEEEEREEEESSVQQPARLELQSSEDTTSHDDASQATYATGTSLRKLLQYACETLFDGAPAQNRRAPAKLFEAGLSLQVPQWGHGHRRTASSDTDASPCSSRTASTASSSASSSSATTPSSEVGSTLRPWA